VSDPAPDSGPPCGTDRWSTTPIDGGNTATDCGPLTCGGGVIAVFESTIPTGQYAGNTNIAAQRIAPDGSLRWSTGGAPLWVSFTTADESRPAAVADGEGGVVVAFEAHTADGAAATSDIWMQRVSANGQLVWGSGGLPVALTSTPTNETGAHGGVVVAYGVAGSGISEVNACLVASTGELSWSEPARIASADPDGLVYLWASPGLAAELVVVGSAAQEIGGLEHWVISESGCLSNRTVLPTAVTGGGPAAELSATFAAPNPFNASTILTFWAQSQEPVDVRVYNAFGQLVRQIRHQPVSSGWQRVRWDGRTDAGANVASGTYLYTIMRSGAVGRPPIVRASGRATLVR